MSSSPGAPAPARPVRALAPIMVVILIVLAASLGYYEIIYYPPNHTTTATVIFYDPKNVTITILPDASTNPRDQTFVPNTITVVVGYNATVFWRNNDSITHTVTANTSDSSLDPRFTAFGPLSPYNNIAPGQILNFTFTVPGTYGYFCSYHPNMVGEIIVKGNSSSTSSGTSSSSGG